MHLPKQILRYIYALCYSFDEVTCTTLSKFFDNLAHDSFNRCLLRPENWTVLLFKICQKLFSIKGGYLIIDEVVISKPFAKAIESLHLFKCPISKKYYPSYKVIVLCWSNEKICIPINFRIWKHGQNTTALELAIEMLALIRFRTDINPEAVLFDSYYASRQVLNAIHCWRWIFCCQIKRNRFLNGKRIDKRSFSPYWTARGYLKEGPKVVVVRHGRKYFCTNDLILGHRSVRTLYRKRWPIEELFRFSKQKLGLTKCQSRKLKAQTAHIAMCFIAYVILQKESSLRDMTDYQIKRELSFQRANFKLFSMDLLFA